MPATIVDGAANDTTPGDWTPALDASFLAAAVGGVEQGSDVLVLIGAPPGASPVGMMSFGAGLIKVNDSSNITNTRQMVALSDCGKSSIFEINPAASNNLSYTLGPNGTRCIRPARR